MKTGAASPYETRVATLKLLNTEARRYISVLQRCLDESEGKFEGSPGLEKMVAESKSRPSWHDIQMSSHMVRRLEKLEAELRELGRAV